ncbi:AI-2E family transporter, partial [Salmonella enterica subsp. enterica]
LGVIAGVMDIIPYLGPWLGVAPAILIALTRSPLEALLVAVIIIVIQIGESNLVYPLVMGKSLDMHPLTIIFILLVAGNLAGLVGMIIGIPA